MSAADDGVLIVGAGPAGVAAALRARVLELPVTLLDDAPAPGGQLHAVHFHPLDVPGFERGDGPELASVYARQLASAGVEIQSGAAAESLRAGGGDGTHPAVRLSGGAWLEAGAVLVATGVRRRRLGVPGERELEGRGVTGSATRDRSQLAGRRVVIVGGGDGAFENALLLSAAGSEVTLLVRGAVRARAEFRARVESEPRIAVRTGARVVAIEGEEHVRAVRFTGAAGETRVETEGVVIKAGSLPNTEWCGGALALDADGFVRVDDRFATRAPRVWAAGDVTRPVPATISVAAGQGTRAAAMIRAALRG